MLVDITEIKLVEKSLRESEKKYKELAASLELKVEEKTIHLREKNEQLKKSEERMREYTNQLEFQNKELQQFAYAASHDMKEPLRKVQFYNSFIAGSSANVLDEKSKEYLNRSIDAARRMQNLIEDLLTYAKTAANVDIFEAIDLNEVIDEIILTHREEYEEDAVEIKRDNLPVVLAIPFQIRQLMSNIVSNSIKYKHPDRNVRIQINAETVSGSSIDQKQPLRYQLYHKISIIDNGVGFDSQFADKIFNIFQRLNNLPEAKGSGIGLAICKRIVQNHHGYIEAAGWPDVGAKFIVYLPKDSNQ